MGLGEMKIYKYSFFPTHSIHSLSHSLLTLSLVFALATLRCVVFVVKDDDRSEQAAYVWSGDSYR